MITRINDFINAQLENLTPRDRKLLAGMVLFFGFVFVGGLWWTLSGMLETKAESVRDAKKQLREVISSAQRMKDAEATIAANESRLNKYRTQRLSAYLESEAKNRNIEDLRSVQEIRSETVGGLKQTTYKVDIKKVPYAEYFNFLAEIESAGYPLRVTNATFKTTKKGTEKVLDVTMEMVVYTVAEGP